MRRNTQLSGAVDEIITDYDLWAQTINDCYFGISSNPLGSKFHGSLSGRRIDGISILRCSSLGIHYERKREHIAQSLNETFLVTVPDVTSVIHTQRSEANVFNPGSFFIERVHEPYTFAQPAYNDLLTIAVDGVTMNNHLGRSDRYCDLAFSAAGGVGRLFVDMVRSVLARRRELTDDEVRVAYAQMLELLGLAIRNDDRVIGSECSSVQAGHLNRVDKFIKAHLDNPALGPTEIAVGCGVSVRYLHRMFSVTGRSVSQHILHKRLSGAQALLRSRGDLRMVDIAYRFGFADQSAFSRHFKREVGVSPSDYRRSNLNPAATELLSVQIPSRSASGSNGLPGISLR